MSRKDITFVGIHRESNEALCPDGECMKLMNMTATKEGLKVLHAPGAEKTITLDSGVTPKKIAYHSQSDKYIVLGSDEKVYSLDNAFSNVSNIYTSTDAKDFQLLGNIVCILTTNGIKYAIWNGTVFVYCGSKPNYPKLLVDDVETKLYMDYVDALEESGIATAEAKSETVTRAKNYTAALMMKQRASAFDDGYFIDRTFFRIGYRLFDGSYLSLSPIYCVEASVPVTESFSLKYYDSSSQSPENHFKVVSITANRDQHNFYSAYSPYTANKFVSYAALAAFKPTFRITVDNLSNWKNFIVGVDLFTTGSIEKHEFHSELNEIGNSYDEWKYLSDDEYSKKLTNNLLFRLYKSYDVNLKETFSVENTNPDILQVQIALSNYLPSSEFAANDDTCSCVYNSRLHIANFTEVLSDVYDPSDYFCVDGGQKHTCFSMIKNSSNVAYYRFPLLDQLAGASATEDLLSYNGANEVRFAWARITNNQLAVVYTKCNTIDGYNYIHRHSMHSIYGSLSPVPSSGTLCPFGGDTLYGNGTSSVGTVSNYTEYNNPNNITSVVESSREALLFKNDWEIAVNVTTEGGIKTIKGFYSVPVAIFNRIASSLLVCHPDSRADTYYIRNTSNNKFSTSLVPDKYSNSAISYSHITTIVDSSSFPSNNRTFSRKNILKVSAIDNPISWPPAQTYAPNNSSITGLSVNNEALSESQHGQNPLYVFTETGIKAMVVDRTGQTVYPAIDDVSNDELTGSMVSIENGVVFASGAGLKLIQGKKVTHISKALEGEDSIVANGAGNTLGATISTATIGSGVKDVVPKLLLDGTGNTKFFDVNFAKYVQGSVLIYHYMERLLYVCNTAYNYSYVYNMNSGEWSQSDTVAKGSVGGTSKCIGLFGANKVKDFDTSWSSINTLYGNLQNRNVYFVTRPIKFGDTSIKKIEQFALEGLIRPLGYSSSDTGLILEDGKYYDASSADYMQLVLLGSMDGLSYQVCGHNKAKRPMNHLVSELYRTNGYRYFIVVLTCKNMRTHSVINGMEFEVTKGLGIRMR